MDLLKELLKLNEAYSDQQIAKAIEKLSSNFLYNADKFMPDIQEWEESLGRNPDLEVFKGEAEQYMDEFMHYAEGDRTMNRWIFDNRFDDLVTAVATKLSDNYDQGSHDYDEDEE